MSRVYRLRTVTGWNTSLTEWYFWTTTFLLGAITTLVGFFISAGLSVDKGMQLPENQLPFLKPLVYGSFIFLLIQIMLSNRLLSQNTQPMAIRADKSRPASMHTILLSLGGLGLLGLLLLIHRTHSNFNLLTALAIISGLCITLGEFFGKIVFYQARRQPGLANPDILWNSNRTILKAYEPLDRGSSHFNKTSD
jgi:DMSO reductase anchor subunit